MQTSSVAYEADGREMVGTLVVPDGSEKRPAVLVAHEGGGLNDHARTIAKRLAELGYVAFALDYYGGGKPLPDREAVNERLMGIIGDPERIRALGRAGLTALLASDRVDTDRVAAIGFCFGGTMVLELARAGTDLKAVVGFHSGLSTARPEDASNIKAKVLVCIGTEDPLISPAERAAFEAEMRAGGVDWRMNLYGGAVHSFTNPDAHLAGFDGIAYDEPTAKRSWRAMLDLFDEALV
jgi:dienelactone hydrolase